MARTGQSLGVAAPPWWRVEWSLALTGLCFFTFAVVTYKLPIGQLGIGVALLGLVIRAREVRAGAPVWLSLAFMVWVLVCFIFTNWKEVMFEATLERAKLLIVLFIVINALRTEVQLRFFQLFYFAFFVLFPVRGTLLGGDDWQGRAVWNYIYNNPNDLATLTLLAMGVGLSILFSPRSKLLLRLGAGASVALMLVVMIRTESRGAFLGLIVGMAPAAALAGLRRPMRAAILVAVAAGVIAYGVPESSSDRISGLTQLTSTSNIESADSSVVERYQIQQVAWRIFTDNPIFGVGLGAYKYVNQYYAPHIGQMDTHNTYLNVASELGFPGLVLWLALVLCVLLRARRSRRRVPAEPLAREQYWIEGSLWGYLVAGIFGSYSHQTFLYLVLGMLWCSATLLDAKEAPKRETTRLARGARPEARA